MCTALLSRPYLELTNISITDDLISLKIIHVFELCRSRISRGRMHPGSASLCIFSWQGNGKKKDVLLYSTHMINDF